MIEARPRTKRVRVQFDLRPEQTPLLDLLEERLGARSRVDLLDAAIGTLLWFVQERGRGRRIVSVDSTELPKLQQAVELAGPASMLPPEDLYTFLVARPHPWRRQLMLKGRSITVGQLVATMQADDMSPEQAAEEMELPLAQVYEALAYYEAQRDLVDAELREDRMRIASM